MSEQVICLSDSDDELIANEECNIAADDVNHDDGEADFTFPAVDFHYNVNKSTSSVFNLARDTDHCIVENSDVFAGTSSDSTNFKSSKNKYEIDVAPSSGVSKKFVNADEPRKNNETEKIKKPRTKNIFEDDTERISAKEQAAIDRRMKAMKKKMHKNMQSGECLKFMRVGVDIKLEKFPFYRDILDALRNYDVPCELESLPIPNSITWTRKIEKHYLNDSNEICKKIEYQSENHIIVVWKYDDTVRRIDDQSFSSRVSGIASLFPDRRLTLIIYGMEEYFERCKSLKKPKSKRKNDARDENSSDDLPKISRYDLEVSLAEIQLTIGCNSGLVETGQELAMLVYRFTKAIAEIPLKLERRQNELTYWYAMGDKRDTVGVDKNCNGLRRLWQQQICQFNLASLETAEAICSVYPSPRELMQAYVGCTQDEGEKLLKDIPIRRAAGPLSAVRKIGPELSKKIFIMFTSKNGEATLSNDRES